MTKYVELNAVLDAIGNQQDGTGMTFEALSHAMRDVMSLPQVDAVPVIRCKDCKYYLLGHDNQFYCFKHDDDILWQDDGFCSFAERKEE